jgi:hypothetical protein
MVISLMARTRSYLKVNRFRESGCQRCGPRGFPFGRIHFAQKLVQTPLPTQEIFKRLFRFGLSCHPLCFPVALLGFSICGGSSALV